MSLSSSAGGDWHGLDHKSSAVSIYASVLFWRVKPLRSIPDDFSRNQVMPKGTVAGSEVTTRLSGRAERSGWKTP
jgi:hypothetical protein